MKYVSMLVAVLLSVVLSSTSEAACCRHRPHLLSRTVHVVRSAACTCATACNTAKQVVVKRERHVVRGTCNGNTCTTK